MDREDVSAPCGGRNCCAAGISAIPAVAGESRDPGARNEAAGAGVFMLQDGEGLFWDEAVARWPVASRRLVGSSHA